MYTINVFTFLFRLLLNLSINRTLKHFGKDYTINCYFFRIHVVSEKNVLKTVLQSQTILTSLNKNFNSSHGLKYTIDNLNTDNPLWGVVHNSIKDAVSGVLNNEGAIDVFFTTTIENFVTIFNNNVQRSLGEKISISEFTDNFTSEWFGTMMIGDSAKFMNLHSSVWNVLKYTFYGNPFRKVPVIGRVTSSFRRWRVSDKIKTVRAMFIDLASTLSDGSLNTSFYGHMYRSIKRQIELNELIDDVSKESLIHDVFVDNAFISVLVYDFVHTVLKGIIMKRIEKGDTLTKHDINTCLEESFLFPYRGREMCHDHQEGEVQFRAGDICLLNLVDSGMLFSYGKRACPGQTMMRPLLQKYVELINQLDLFIDEPDGISELDRRFKVVRSKDSDAPFILNDCVGYVHDKKIITKNNLIPVHKRPGEPPLKNVWSVFTNTALMKGMMAVFDTTVKPKCDYDVIVAPEARALPLAGMISVLNKDKAVPIVVLTKADKFGPAIKKTYTRGYTEDPTTICLYDVFRDTLKNKKALFVDDGLASGGTTCACIKMIEEAGGSVTGIFVVVKHNYCELIKEYTNNYMHITHWCYEL